MGPKTYETSLIKKLISSGVIITVLFAILIPPICSFILGYEFTGQLVNHVPTGIYDQDNSALSRSLVENIKTNDAFDVKGFAEQDSDINNWMHSSKIATGIIIPKNFSQDLLNGKSPELMVIYDGSQMAMTGAVKIRISEIIGTIRAGFILQIMQGKLSISPAEAQKYIQPINYTTRLLGNPARSTANYILQGILLSIAQVAIYCLGIELADFVRERRNRAISYITVSIISGLIGVATIFATLLIQIRIFHSPFNGSFTLAMGMTLLNMIGISNLGIWFVMIIKNKKWALATTTLVMAMVLLSGYTYPALAMPPLFQAVAKIIPFTYYGLPMRDITLLGANAQQVMPQIIWLVQFVIFGWVIILITNLLQFIKISSSKSLNLADKKGANHGV